MITASFSTQLFKVAKKAGLQPERKDSSECVRRARSSDSFVIHRFRGKLLNEILKKNIKFSKDVKLKVEEFRTKEEGEEYPESFWKERFKSFTDHKQVFESISLLSTLKLHMGFLDMLMHLLSVIPLEIQIHTVFIT
ncbi:unnamed protein product [Caenorhabditis brenneri]